MCDPDHLQASELHRMVLRRLVELSGEQRRLLTPSQLVSDGWVELDGSVCPAGVQPPYLVKALDELAQIELAERIVPTVGESSYRPTEVGRQRALELEED